MDAFFTIHCWLARYQQQQMQLLQWRTQLENILTPVGMTISEFLLLEELYQAQEAGRTQVELVGATQFSAAQVSGLIDSLAKRGWLHTQRATHDRRRVICTLAEKGRAEMCIALSQLSSWVAMQDASTELNVAAPITWEDAA